MEEKKRFAQSIWNFTKLNHQTVFYKKGKRNKRVSPPTQISSLNVRKVIRIQIRYNISIFNWTIKKSHFKFLWQTMTSPEGGEILLPSN